MRSERQPTRFLGYPITRARVYSDVSRRGVATGDRRLCERHPSMRPVT
jgi:hypothetical protein